MVVPYLHLYDTWWRPRVKGGMVDSIDQHWYTQGFLTSTGIHKDFLYIYIFFFYTQGFLKVGLSPYEVLMRRQMLMGTDAPHNSNLNTVLLLLL